MEWDYEKNTHMESEHTLRTRNVAGRRARKETDRLCSDDETGGRDGKAER
jgi:hypothetical protein